MGTINFCREVCPTPIIISLFLSRSPPFHKPTIDTNVAHTKIHFQKQPKDSKKKFFLYGRLLVHYTFILLLLLLVYQSSSFSPFSFLFVCWLYAKFRNMDILALDDIINRLLEVRGRPGKQVQLSEAEIRQLCLKSKEIFLQQPNLLELDAPIKICGTTSSFRFFFFSIFKP